MGFFQKTSDPLQAVPKIKYSADYASLQAAMNDLQEGDTLIVNADYTLTTTVELTRSNVQILGRGALIKPSSNGNPSPLLRIKNTSNTPTITNVSINGMRFRNADGVSDGNGTGIALEVLDDYPTVNNGFVWHIKIEDVDASNFSRAISLKNCFDIVIDNCQCGGNNVALRCETTTTAKSTGQVKVFGGFYIGNQYHISCDGATGTGTADLSLFGVSMGHQRTGAAGGSIGVFVGKDSNGITMFGCHLEDLASGVYVASGTFVAVIGVFGSRFVEISNTGVDTADSVGINSISLIANWFGVKSGSSAVFYKAPVVNDGVLIGANLRSSNDTRPAIGYIEHSPGIGQSVYRVPTYSDSTRPSASSVPPGSIIRNSTTNKLNVSDGSNWRDAIGNIV
jgi:hypothetical protein